MPKTEEEKREANRKKVANWRKRRRAEKEKQPRLIRVGNGFMWILDS